MDKVQVDEEIKIIDLPDGGCVVEFDGEVSCYSKEEVEEMERDYKAAIVMALTKRGDVS